MNKQTFFVVTYTVYLVCVFTIWFFSSDYLGGVPDSVANDTGLSELKDWIRSFFHRDYIF